MGAKEPLIITDKDQMRKWSRAARAQGKPIALVPTMGFLHQGHISLITEARNHNHNHLIVVSIYVNPGQFSPSEDLSVYPSDFEGDIRKLRDVPGGLDVVFHPQNLYDHGNIGASVNGPGDGGVGGVVSCLEERGLGHETWVRVERLEKGLCGKSRPVFFRGVATVVSKLFNIVEPDVAVFGKKDYQQWRIIQRMVSFWRVLMLYFGLMEFGYGFGIDVELDKITCEFALEFVQFLHLFLVHNLPNATLVSKLLDGLLLDF